MKLQFAIIFSVLSLSAYAEQYGSAPVSYTEIPMSEVVTTYSSPIYEQPRSYSISESITTTVLGVDNVSELEETTLPKRIDHIVAKPPEKPIAVPLPIGPLLPLQDDLPIHENVTETVRGQVETVDSLKDALESPLPPALGVIDAGTIDPKLTESPVLLDTTLDDTALNLDQGSHADPAPSGATVTDPLSYGVLLAAMVITTIGLVYMAFVAYDYRQRWMQSLTMQNDRYIGGTFDLESEDAFGVKSWG